MPRRPSLRRLLACSLASLLILLLASATTGLTSARELLSHDDEVVRSPAVVAPSLSSTLRAFLTGRESGIAKASVSTFRAADTAQFHTVVDGDTLSDIAARFGTTVRAIVAANGIADPSRLSLGESLVIPPENEQADDMADVVSTDPARFSWPAYGPITTEFGEPGGLWVVGYHEGLDIAVMYGYPVRSAADGVVLEADSGWNRGYGTYIKIDHGYGVQTLYGHLSRWLVDPGQWVNRGEIIGYVGDTGYAVGAHLHFEVRLYGQPDDPMKYLPGLY